MLLPVKTMYGKLWKRVLDFVVSLLALLVLSPLLAILTIVGCAVMRGNPFFVQPRPGKDERIFRLVKFRTMTNARDDRGELLPDEARLNRYGRFLRSTSLDELPELWNVLKGDMSLVGPRPLLVKYLPRYNETQHRRHDVRPGITGYAQVHGRNALSWEDRFALDLWYVEHVSLRTDVRILLSTVAAVAKRDGISSDTSVTMEEFMGTDEKAKSAEA